MNRWKLRMGRKLRPMPGRPFSALDARLRWLNRYLQDKTASVSPGARKVFLGLFCLAFAVGSIAAIFDGLRYRSRKGFLLPVHFELPVMTVPAPPPVNGGELERIERFRHYLAVHKSYRDSLVRIRPKLDDTLDFLHELYKKFENGK